MVFSDAIKLARNEAGIDEDDEITILQYPTPKLFDLSSLLGGMVGVNIEDPTERIQNVKYRLENSEFLCYYYLQNTGK